MRRPKIYTTSPPQDRPGIFLLLNSWQHLFLKDKPAVSELQIRLPLYTAYILIPHDYAPVQAAAVVPAAASRNNLSIRTFGLDPGPFSSCFDASVVPAFNSSSDT